VSPLCWVRRQEEELVAGPSGSTKREAPLAEFWEILVQRARLIDLMYAYEKERSWELRGVESVTSRLYLLTLRFVCE
jgi:hypothetical protein